MNCILFVFFFFLFLVRVDSKSCLASPQAVKCLEVARNLGDQAGNITYPESITPLTESCGKFRRCVPVLSCDPNPDLAHVMNITVMFCDAFRYFTIEFKSCQVKLESNLSDCTSSWDPYPKDVKDKKAVEKVQKEKCQNYFGKDNCMKAEIIQVCGVEQWHGFRKAHLALNTIMGACQFKEGEL